MKQCMCKNKKDISISGTEIKLNIHVDPLGSLHMADYNFECKFYIFPKKFITINKADMVKIDDDNYMCIVDTTELGIGDLHLTLIAQIPDSDFENTLRREVVCVDTGIEIIKC